MQFLPVESGELIAEKYIIAVGKPESWPHGVFHRITFAHGEFVHEARATEQDVQAFLRSTKHGQ